MEWVPNLIKIGGAVSEKNGNIGQTFVVLYIGLREIFKHCIFDLMIQFHIKTLKISNLCLLKSAMLENI